MGCEGQIADCTHCGKLCRVGRRSPVVCMECSWEGHHGTPNDCPACERHAGQLVEAGQVKKNREGVGAVAPTPNSVTPNSERQSQIDEGIMTQEWLAHA